MTKEEIKNEIAECEEKLKSLREELDKPEYDRKRWKPKVGDYYYYIYSNDEVASTWFDSLDDVGTYKTKPTLFRGK